MYMYVCMCACMGPENIEVQIQYRFLEKNEIGALQAEHMNPVVYLCAYMYGSQENLYILAENLHAVYSSMPLGTGVLLHLDV